MNNKKKFSKLKVDEFKNELSDLVNKISVKLLALSIESDKEIAIESLTMALMQITAALAIQSECPKDIFLQINELAFDGALKQEMKDIYKDIDLIKTKNKSQLN